MMELKNKDRHTFGLISDFLLYANAFLSNSSFAFFESFGFTCKPVEIVLACICDKSQVMSYLWYSSRIGRWRP